MVFPLVRLMRDTDNTVQDKNKEIEMLTSPPSSSDLKQIEHLWNMEHPPGCCYSNRGMHIYKLRTSLAFHVGTVYACALACVLA